ncbi:MAG: peptide deformylase, partial [Kofleriaceae bacterium]
MLPIVQVGDPVLRALAAPVALADLPSLAQLVADMRDTMRAAPGVGLAAPQIGRSLALAVIEDAPVLHANLTPEQLADRERSAVPF